MVNRLKMAIVQSILSLHAQGWSARRIARTLGVSRDAVARHLRRARQSAEPDPAGGPNKAIAPIDPARVPGGSNKATPPTLPPTAPAAPNPAIGPAARPVPLAGAGRQSHAARWRELILAKQRQGLSAKRIHQDLVAETGAAQLSYDSVRRFLKRAGAPPRPLPFRRMHSAPGQEAQIDFGTGAPIITPDGKRRKTHVFRIVLSHSRKAYSEACHRQTTEDFIRCIENALWHFGGVPQTLVIDNLKAAVAHPDWFDPEINPKLQSFCRHYGTVILPTRPYRARHKGKIERGIGYVKNNALAGHTFTSLEAQNRHLAHWEQTVADTRIHGTTKQQVGKLFAEVERAALLPLPAERFPFFQEAQRIVNRDGHIEVAKAYYSVPPEYLGRSVWARWDSRLVRVFNHRFEQIALHVRHTAGRFSTLGEHLAPEKISGLERGAKFLLGKVSGVGPQVGQWAEKMLQARGIEGTRVLQGLAALVRKHPRESLEKACEIALSHGAFRLRTIRQLLKRQPAVQQPLLPFLEEHPLIRPLQAYSDVVAAALARQAQARSGAAAPQGFLRNGWANECVTGKEHGPGGADRQGPRDIHPPRSDYPSSGCSSAEPDSVSPDS